MATFNFELLDLPPEAEKLRGEVREFLRETVGEGAPTSASGPGVATTASSA